MLGIGTNIVVFTRNCAHFCGNVKPNQMQSHLFKRLFIIQTSMMSWIKRYGILYLPTSTCIAVVDYSTKPSLLEYYLFSLVASS